MHTWLDNLVPALKKSTTSTFEHSLVLGKVALFRALIWKPSTISKHYRHWLWKFAHLLTTALSLSVENGCGICVRSIRTTSSSKSTLIMTASQGDISTTLTEHESVSIHTRSLMTQSKHSDFSSKVTIQWAALRSPSRKENVLEIFFFSLSQEGMKKEERRKGSTYMFYMHSALYIVREREI